jgi:deoxyribose-phosphate aldolase
MKINSPRGVAAFIDHTLLKATTTAEQIDALCAEAREHGFASVCINPCFVVRAAKNLADCPVKVCTVIGFPLGATSREAKAFEARQAVEDGADEVDMVLNVSMLKSGDTDYVLEDIESVVDTVPESVVVKVILETCYLSEYEIRTACRLARDAGADFVKTSTGFGSGGATLEAVRTMVEEVGDSMEIKASGGIRDYPTAKAMLEAGATRLGVSAGVAIVADS